MAGCTLLQVEEEVAMAGRAALFFRLRRSVCREAIVWLV